MASSCCTAQLSLWREIISKCHEKTKPVAQHVEFIQKRFDELDSKGFTWSKESILDIFLQLGLSESPHRTSSSVNDLPESRVGQENEISFDGLKEVIQTVKLEHKSRPVGLLDLPIEVFHKILEQLNCMVGLEDRENYIKKHLAKVIITGPGDRKPYTTYLHQNSPILNSIQTFSLTSREIYNRCEPWLWRKLSFPTILPAPIDLWTKDILLRRGCHVRSLKLYLSENCSKPPSDPVYDPFYDNLIADPNFHSNWISPKNAKDLILQCPNLSHLSFYYSHDEEDEDIGQTEAFLSDLIPLLSNLKLQHFSLGSHTAIKEFPSKVVACLPLLESLIVRHYSRSGKQETVCDDSFGFNLSKLEYLSQLSIGFNEDINEKWCFYNWPGTITDLSICNRGDLLPSLAFKIIRHISPRLTKLNLSLDCIEEEERSAPPSLYLPSLTHLTLNSGNANLLASFRECKSLCYLEWTYWTIEYCRSVNRLLFEGTWPHLKKLCLRGFLGPDLDPFNPEVEHQIQLLENHCEQVNIKTTIYRYFDEYDFDVPDSSSDT